MILPVSVLIIGSIYIRNSGFYFLRSVDPEYGYLLGGTMLACFKPDIQFITNPGIPVHFIVALVARLVHIFRPGLSLLDDVLLHPEIYIRASLYAINGLNVIFLFITGLFAYRYTQSIITSLFLQLMPMTNLLMMESLARLIPEALMLIITCCWLMLILPLIFNHGRAINYRRYSILFGLLFALGITDKLTYFPYLFIPLLLLPDWKHRMWFGIYSVLFFIILGYPVILNHQFFTDWVISIFTHTGPYGQGDRGFIHIKEFTGHLNVLLDYTRIMITSTVVLFLVSLFYLYKKGKQGWSDLILKLNIALVAAVILQYIMASKHFAYHYMIPSLLMTTLIIIMIVTSISAVVPIIKKPVVSLTLGISGILIMLWIFPKMNNQLKGMKKVTIEKTVAYYKLAPLIKQSPRIISPSYYGCSSLDYALAYGLLVSGKYGDFLYKAIADIYPGVYMYFPWGKTFYKGNHEIKPQQFLQPGIDYTVYIAEYDPAKRDELVKTLQTSMPDYQAVISPVDSVQSTSEVVFSMKFIPCKSGNIDGLQ